MLFVAFTRISQFVNYDEINPVLINFNKGWVQFEKYEK